jgi:hypothetical protein
MIILAYRTIEIVPRMYTNLSVGTVEEDLRSRTNVVQALKSKLDEFAANSCEDCRVIDYRGIILSPYVVCKSASSTIGSCALGDCSCCRDITCGLVSWPGTYGPIDSFHVDDEL